MLTVMTNQRLHRYNFPNKYTDYEAAAMLLQIVKRLWHFIYKKVYFSASVAPVMSLNSEYWKRKRYCQMNLGGDSQNVTSYSGTEQIFFRNIIIIIVILMNVCSRKCQSAFRLIKIALIA